MGRFRFKRVAAAVACTAGLVGGAIAMSAPAYASTQVQAYTCDHIPGLTAEFDYTTSTLWVQADISAILTGNIASVTAELGYSTPITVSGSVTGGFLLLSNSDVPTDPGAPPETMSITASDQEQSITTSCTAV